MPKTTGDYQAWKLQKLSDPGIAAQYLTDILENSPEIFLTALRNVAQAREVSNVAKEANVARENIYRAFSAQGNPTWDTLLSVLRALGVKLSRIDPVDRVTPAVYRVTPASPKKSGRGRTFSGVRKKRGRSDTLEGLQAAGQTTLNFVDQEAATTKTIYLVAEATTNDVALGGFISSLQDATYRVRESDPIVGLKQGVCGEILAYNPITATDAYR